MRFKAAHFVLMTLLAGSLWQNRVEAELLMEDTFDYAVGDLHGSNGGVGWNSTWDYADNAGVTGSGTVEEGSLAFSNYPALGNRARLANTGSSNIGSVERQYNRLSRTSGVDVLEGDLWIAYLFQRVDENGATDAWAELRNNNCFCLGMTAKAGTNYFDASTNGLGVATRYDNTPGTPDGSVNIHDGETYLMVGRFTDINSTEPNRSGTIWALNAADYDAIKAGGITAGELDSHHQLMSIDTDPGLFPSRILLNHTMRWVNGVNFRGENLDIYDPFIFDFDELRYGTSLADVVLVPTGNGGDYNGDGTVDAADYVVWRRSMADGTGPDGDGTTTGDLLGVPDGIVDAWDYDFWRSQFGTSVGSGSVHAVPEPASFVSVCIGLLVCMVGVRKRLAGVG